MTKQIHVSQILDKKQLFINYMYVNEVLSLQVIGSNLNLAVKNIKNLFSSKILLKIPELLRFFNQFLKFNLLLNKTIFPRLIKIQIKVNYKMNRKSIVEYNLLFLRSCMSSFIHHTKHGLARKEQSIYPGDLIIDIISLLKRLKYFLRLNGTIFSIIILNTSFTKSLLSQSHITIKILQNQKCTPNNSKKSKEAFGLLILIILDPIIYQVINLKDIDQINLDICPLVDFIIGINSYNLKPTDKDTILKWFSLKHQKPFTITIYSIIQNIFKKIVIDNETLISIELRNNSFIYQPFSHAQCEIMIIDSILQNSKADELGLIARKDYILSTQNLKFQDSQTFAEEIQKARENTIEILVYNSDSHSLRNMNLRLDKKEQYFGCNVILLNQISLNYRVSRYQLQSKHLEQQFKSQSSEDQAQDGADQQQHSQRQDGSNNCDSYQFRSMFGIGKIFKRFKVNKQSNFSQIPQLSMEYQIQQEQKNIIIQKAQKQDEAIKLRRQKIEKKQKQDKANLQKQQIQEFKKMYNRPGAQLYFKQFDEKASYFFK